MENWVHAKPTPRFRITPGMKCHCHQCPIADLNKKTLKGPLSLAWISEVSVTERSAFPRLSAKECPMCRYSSMSSTAILTLMPKEPTSQGLRRLVAKPSRLPVRSFEMTASNHGRTQPWNMEVIDAAEQPVL